MAAKTQRAEATLRLHAGRLRLVAVADTHGAPHPRTRELVMREKPDAILHAGDIGDLRVVRDLETIAPVLAVRGNIDPPDAGPDVLRVDLVRDDALFARILLLHIGVAGARLRGDAAALARAEDASLVVCGHSHVPFAVVDRGLGVFNPGSIGPRRFRLPIVFGVIDVSESGIALRHVDCETGETFAPPSAPTSRSASAR